MHSILNVEAFFLFRAVLIAWLIIWLIIWLINWLIVRLIGWLTDCLVVRLIDWLIDRIRHCFSRICVFHCFELDVWDEEWFFFGVQVFYLPSLRPFTKYKLTAHEGSQLRHVREVKFISKQGWFDGFLITINRIKLSFSSFLLERNIPKTAETSSNFSPESQVLSLIEKTERRWIAFFHHESRATDM